MRGEEIRIADFELRNCGCINQILEIVSERLRY